MSARLKLHDGTEVTYRVLGEGVAVLGMPGGPGISSDYLASFAEPLMDGLAWHLIDPPGTGGTTSATDYSISGHADFYREVASTLGLDRVVVFGHSYSGTVAPTFAATYPEITLGCLLVAPPVVGTDIDEAEGGGIRSAMNGAMARHQNQPWYEDAVEAAFNPDMTDIEASLRKALPLSFSDPTDDILNRALNAFTPFQINMDPMMWFYEKEWPTLDLRPLINDLQCPLLALVGEHDWEVPPIQANFYRKSANGRVVEIADCGHYVQVEAPTVYASAVRDWLHDSHLA